MTLCFVERHERYSVYRRKLTDETVYLQHGTRARLVPMAEVYFPTLWEEYLSTAYDPYWDRRSKFVTFLGNKVIESADEIYNELAYCNSCDRPINKSHEDVTEIIAGYRYACRDCISEYLKCNDCDALVHCSATYTVTLGLDEIEVCGDCVGSSYFYCEECESYFSNEEHGDHRHQDCDCEAPMQSFRLRNDGHEMLANDTRVTIPMPAGEIDQNGLMRIYRLVLDHLRCGDPIEVTGCTPTAVAYSVYDIGEEWQNKKGNFTKRLSSHLYKTYGVKLPPEIMSSVGVIARDHSKGKDFSIEVTRNLNLSPGEFYHDESCWWGQYASGRCALKSNGGFGLRSFDENDNVTGRAWVMPLTHSTNQYGEPFFKPTFNTENPDCFVVFNGYGDLESYAPARILAHMAGMTYKKIEFDCRPMYVNAGGYLVAPQDIIESTSYISLTTMPHATIATQELVNA